MKKRIKIFLTLIIIFLILLSINVNSSFVLKETNELINAYNNNNLVRLHVVANSNSPYDQYIKRKVRNEVVNYLTHYSHTNFLDELDNIKVEISKILKKEKVNYSLDIDFGNYFFPKRTYDEITLPAGEYKALRIILGEGQGANWWCVLLPPLCIKNKIVENEEVQFRLKILDLLKGEKIEPYNWTKKMFKKINIIERGLYINPRFFTFLTPHSYIN